MHYAMPSRRSRISMPLHGRDAIDGETTLESLLQAQACTDPPEAPCEGSVVHAKAANRDDFGMKVSPFSIGQPGLSSCSGGRDAAPPTSGSPTHPWMAEDGCCANPSKIYSRGRESLLKLRHFLFMFLSLNRIEKIAQKIKQVGVALKHFPVVI